MYTRENILALASKVLSQMKGCYTTKGFLEEFHKLSPYPSTSTLYHRFGSIKKLVYEAWGWERRKENQ